MSTARAPHGIARAPHGIARAPHGIAPAPHRSARRLATGLLALAFLAPLAGADRVLTQDGRILTAKKAREQGAGYVLTFEHGTITLADRSLVQSVEVEGDMSDYVPQNDDERAKLAQGYVKHRGRWLSAPAYQEELRKQAEKSRKRTEELAAHSDWSNAWTRKTPHFVVRTNTSPELLDYYCELMEAYYRLQDDRIGIDPPPSLKRAQMQVNVYKSHEEFQALANPGSPSVLGFFSPMDKSLNFFHDYAEPARSDWVALHECTHLLTFLIDPQYLSQIWLNEGVADYFGSSKITRDKKGKLVIEPGELQLDRVLTVQLALKQSTVATGEGKGAAAKGGTDASKRPFTPLAQLFRLEKDQFDGFQYAHAWAFVYFLNTFDGARYQKSFDKFFKAIYTLEKGIPYDVQPWPVPEAGGTGRKIPPDAIRDELLKRLKVKELDALEAELKQFVAAIPVEGPKARLKRGLFAVRQLRFAEGIEDLDAAIEGGATDPRAWASRGMARAATGKLEEAIADLRVAIEKDPLQGSFRYSLSQLLCGVAPRAGKPSASGSSGASSEVGAAEGEAKLKNAEARTEAGLAMELAPDNDRFREWFERFEE